MERRDELEKGIIGLMRSLGMPSARIMFIIALIRVYHLHEELAEWMVGYIGREDTLTVQAFMSKLNELTDESDNTDKDYDQH